MNSTGNSQFAGPITQVAAHAQQRRLSLSTVGLGTASGQPSPFNNLRSRGDSMSSGTSASVDESPFEDGDAAPSSATASPFARRLSFGARALRDVRASNGNGNLNGRHSVAKASPPTAKGRGSGSEGFNFAENMRTRAERTSISSASIPSPQTHQRAKSVAILEPPVREMPKVGKPPDAFQERILKGDFYMD
ncbi:hypothetical protein LTS18_010578 [Coniosporium uncinatum]|uniref:Uncharacterized protein n=1 Tax=Coniosporium uncinatum TaxID=93489 RepID=A0ACC3CZC9_9PEZI|nr:hypothetical protein LTS18_010578 [Coniosporium uncinatum]